MLRLTIALAVQRRFLTVSIAFVIFWTAISVAVTGNLVQIRKQFGKIINRNFEAVFALQELYGETARMREEAIGAALLLLLTEGPDTREEIEAELTEMNEAHEEARIWLDVYRSAAANRDNSARFDEIEAVLDGMYRFPTDFVRAAGQGDIGAVARQKIELERFEDLLMEFIMQAIEEERRSLHSREHMVNQFTLRSTIVFGLVILVLIVAITVGTLRFARSVLSPLDVISNFAAAFHPKDNPTVPTIEPPNALHHLHSAVATMARRASNLTRDLTERNQRLERSMAINETLIHEVHHRVKNNLQVVISLLNLQVGTEAGSAVREHLGKARSRLYAIALVHKLLYSSEDQTVVQLEDYLPMLVSAIETSIDDTGAQFRVAIDVEPCALEIDLAIQIGLITNELSTNSFKHAYRADAPCIVNVRFVRVDDRGVLSVRDNGPGIRDDFQPDRVESLGLKIVSVTTAQLGGNVEYVNDNGLVVTVSFPVEPVSNRSVMPT